MVRSLLDDCSHYLAGDFARLAGAYLGEAPKAIDAGIAAFLPAFLLTVCTRGADPRGAMGLVSVLGSPDMSVLYLDNLGSYAIGDAAVFNSLTRLAMDVLVPATIGEKTERVATVLAQAADMRCSSATGLIALTVSIACLTIKRKIMTQRLSGGELALSLKEQQCMLQGMADPRMTEAIVACRIRDYAAFANKDVPTVLYTQGPGMWKRIQSWWAATSGMKVNGR